MSEERMVKTTDGIAITMQVTLETVSGIADRRPSITVVEVATQDELQVLTVTNLCGV